MYKALIFDFDMTLADSSEGIVLSFKHTLERFGYEIPSDDEIKKTIGIPLTDGFDVLTNIYPNPYREEMKEVYIAKANEVMTPKTYLFPYTEKLICYLNNNGIKCAIVSSKLRFRIEEGIEHLMKYAKVDLIIGLDDVNEPKPSSEGIEKAINSFGLSKDEILYVGDSYIDAQTAQNACVDFCAVTTGTTTREDFSEYNCKYIVDSLEKLYEIINVNNN